MSTALLFDFIVDKENKTIVIKREFNAGVDLVWKAWTTPEFLEQWVAPRPFRAETVTMDFREGGFWHYAMVSPEGDKKWTRYDYQQIEPQKKIVELRGFTDESGTVNPDFPRTICTNLFKESNGKTMVEITAVYGSLEILEFIVKHGFIDGMSACFGNLDEFLATFKK